MSKICWILLYVTVAVFPDQSEARGGAMPTVHLSTEREVYEESKTLQTRAFNTVEDIPELIEKINNTAKNLDHINLQNGGGYREDYFLFKTRPLLKELTQMRAVIDQIPQYPDAHNITQLHPVSLINTATLYRLHDETQDRHRQTRDTRETKTPDSIISGGQMYDGMTKYWSHLEMPGCPKNLVVTYRTTKCVISALKKVDSPRAQNVGELGPLIVASLGKTHTWRKPQLITLSQLLDIPIESPENIQEILKNIINILSKPQVEQDHITDIVSNNFKSDVSELLDNSTMTEVINALVAVETSLDIMEAETSVLIKNLDKKHSEISKENLHQDLEYSLMMASSFLDLFTASIVNTRQMIQRGGTSIINGRIEQVRKTDQNVLVFTYYPITRIPKIMGHLHATNFCNTEKCVTYNTKKLVGSLDLSILFLEKNCHISLNKFICKRRLATPPKCFYPSSTCQISLNSNQVDNIRKLNQYTLFISHLDREMEIGPFFLSPDHFYVVSSQNTKKILNITILRTEQQWEYHLETFKLDIEQIPELISEKS